MNNDGMEIRSIIEFVHLAETRSFSESAKLLNISQSSLSRHIQILEKELGSPLFTRTTRRMELSEFGRFYLPYAKRIARLNDETDRAVQLWQKKNTATVTVGISHYAHLFSITESIAAFRKENPDIVLRMVEKSISGLHSDLREGLLSLITVAYPAGAELPDRFIKAGESHLVAVVPDTHILATYSVIPLYHLSGRTVLLPEKESLFERLFLAVTEREGIEPNVTYQGSLKNRLELVRQESGIIIDEERVASEQIRDTSLLILPLEPEIRFVYGLEYASRLNTNEYRYMKFIRDRFR